MFVYLEMPKFNKTIEELETKYDKWLFVLKNLHKLDRVPDKLREDVFVKLFQSAEISKFTTQEYQEYEDSLKYYRDLKNSLYTAKEEGKIEGKVEIAKEMKSKGFDTITIVELTGLSKEQIEGLQ